MDPKQQSTVVGTTRLDPGAGPGDRLLCERLHEADGLTLVRTRLFGDSEWQWRAFAPATAFGYVARGTVAFDLPDSAADGFDTTGDGPASEPVLGPDTFFKIPSGHSPTLRRAADSGPVELLVGFETESADSVGSDGETAQSSGTPSAGSIRVAERSDLASASELSSVNRETPFPDASIRMVRGHSDGEIVSEWHHHGDNHVFGYVLEGDGFVEWGAGEGERKLVGTHECFHIPAEFVHRDRSVSDGRQEYVLWLTGSDPRTVHVDGPTVGTSGSVPGE
jgi:mannose-6-phosphate isomerase-like protein (cupin superfamily)